MVRTGIFVLLATTFIASHARAEAITLIGSVTYTEFAANWNLRGPELSGDFPHDDTTVFFRCAVQPCRAGEFATVHVDFSCEGCGFGGPFGAPMTFRGRQGFGQVTTNELDGPLVPIPSSAAPFILTSPFRLGGRVGFTTERAGGATEVVPVRGTGTAFMSFVAGPVADSFQLSSIKFEFDDTNAVPEPATLSLVAAASGALLALRRRRD